MDAKRSWCAETDVEAGHYERVVRLLRAAAVGDRQTDARRRWVRAATRC